MATAEVEVAGDAGDEGRKIVDPMVAAGLPTADDAAAAPAPVTTLGTCRPAIPRAIGANAAGRGCGERSRCLRRAERKRRANAGAGAPSVSAATGAPPSAATGAPPSAATGA